MPGYGLTQALVISYDASAHTAVVRPEGSVTAYVAGIAVASNIPAADVLAGRRAVVVQFDRFNPGEAVLIAVY